MNGRITASSTGAFKAPFVSYRTSLLRYWIHDWSMAMNNTNDGAAADPTDALRSFCAVGFRSDIDATALVLGRPPAEIRKMLDGEMPVDDDLEMKIRGIAQERNFKL